MPVILGTYGDTGPGGWTSFTLPAGARIIYVSNSGSDSNNGLTVSTPKQTLTGPNGGQSLLRAGVGDWLLLKKGDAWSDTDAVFMPLGASGSYSGIPAWYGASANEPVVIGSYDPSQPGVINPSTVGNRPMLRTPYQDPTTRGAQVCVQPSNTAFVGLDIYGYTRDPYNTSFTGSGGNGPQAFLKTVFDPGWLLIEDCRFIYLYGISIQGDTPALMNNVRIRRCIFFGGYTSTGGNISDLYGANFQTTDGSNVGIRMEENTHDICGYNDYVSGGAATVFNHAVYVSAYIQENQYDSYAWPGVFKGNIYSRDATGQQFRCGGTIFNNLFTQGAYHHNFAGPHFGASDIEYNVGIGPLISRGTSLSFRAVSSTDGSYASHGPPPQPMVGDVIYKNNVITNSRNQANLEALYIVNGWNATVDNNIFYYNQDAPSITVGGVSIRSFSSFSGSGTANTTTWHVPLSYVSGTGGSGAYADVTTGSGGAVSSCVVSLTTDSAGNNQSWYGGSNYSVGNVLTGPIAGGTVTCTVGAVTSTTVGAGNKIDYTGSTTGGSYGFPMNGHNASIMGNNTIDAYAGSIGVTPATLAGLMRAATGCDPTMLSPVSQGQCRASWNYNYTAAAVNSYIRAGFAMADPGGGVVTVSPGSIPGTGTVGTTYPTQNFSASGGIAPYTWSISSGAVPPGLVFHTATAVLDGIPTSAGSYSFTVQAQDSASTPLVGSQPYSIAVSVAPTITVSPSTLPSGTVNVAYSQNITASGGTAPYTFAMTPSNALTGSGLTLASNGLLSGTPTTATTYSFSVTATDSTTNASAPKAYSLVINPVAVPGPSVRFVHTKK